MLRNFGNIQNIEYLGSLLKVGRRSSGEIRRWIPPTEILMMKLHTVTNNQKIVLSLVLPVFLYVAETWTLKMANINEVDVAANTENFLVKSTNK